MAEQMDERNIEAKDEKNLLKEEGRKEGKVDKLRNKWKKEMLNKIMQKMTMKMVIKTNRKVTDEENWGKEKYWKS